MADYTPRTWNTGDTFTPAQASAMSAELEEQEVKDAEQDSRLTALEAGGSASWASLTGKPAVIAAGADQAAARSAIGAVDAAAVTTAVNAVLDGAPGALDTLNELAAAIGDDANFAATITTALNNRQPLDADLTAIAALTTTTFGRSLLTQADAPTLRVLSGDYVGQRRSGSGAPSNSLGYDGDTYSDYTNGKLYTKTAGVWAATIDTTVVKEATIPGSWSTNAGTLTANVTDGMTTQRLASASSGTSLCTYTCTGTVNLVGKVLQLPLRVDALADWVNYLAMDISATADFAARASLSFIPDTIFRGGEVEAFRWAPNTGYLSGTPDFSAIKYMRIAWQLTANGVSKNAYMGVPSVISP